MCYFNFLTGKAYKANSDIANILSDYCKKNAIQQHRHFLGDTKMNIEDLYQISGEYGCH